MTDEKFLRKSQQGELDAVPMYYNLSKKFEKKNPEVSEMLKSMAADEGKHALFFKNISGEVLKPKQFLAKMVPALMSIFGAKFVFKFVAKFEYDAYDTYDPWVKKFPGLEKIQADEIKHGNMVKEIIEKLKKKI